MKAEIGLIFRSVTDLLEHTDLLHEICWAIILTNLTLYPAHGTHFFKSKSNTVHTPGTYMLENSQKEIFILKMVLANLNPIILKHILGFGLSLERLLLGHLLNNFIDLLNSEFCLAVRDIFYLLNFYDTVEDVKPNYLIYMLFKSCMVSAIFAGWEDMFLKTSNGADFESQFLIYCKQE